MLSETQLQLPGCCQEKKKISFLFEIQFSSSLLCDLRQVFQIMRRLMILFY